MTFSKGKTRAVLAFPSLGFVIKFPLIQFSFVARKMLDDWRDYGGKGLWRPWVNKVENPYGYPFRIFGGIWANLLEFYLWHTTKNSFLYPTWFSFFGLFNIQKYGKPLTLKEQWVGFVVERVSKGASAFCGHGFETPDNYSSQKGHLRLIDYGSKKLWPIILKHGQELSLVTIEECCSEESARSRRPS